MQGEVTRNHSWKANGLRAGTLSSGGNHDSLLPACSVCSPVGMAACKWLDRIGAGTSADASSKLRELLEASDEAELDRNPIGGIFRGDLRRAARFSDYASEAYVAAEKIAAANELQELAAIPRERLTPPERIAYDTFRWSRADSLEKNSPPASLIWPRLSLDHHNGWHVFFPEFSSGDGIAPYHTVKDYKTAWRASTASWSTSTAWSAGCGRALLQVCSSHGSWWTT